MGAGVVEGLEGRVLAIFEPCDPSQRVLWVGKRVGDPQDGSRDLLEAWF